MTEQEWLNCPYANRMIAGRRGWRRSTRKLRLLACACLRRVWPLLSPAGRHGVEVAELHADGKVSNAELQAASLGYKQRGKIADNGVHCVTAANRLFRSWVAGALSHAAWAVAVEGPKHDAEVLAQVSLVRDVFGNPYQAIAIDPGWRPPTVTALAQTVYDRRAFEHLPILADALEEAGCTDAAVLDHCRGPGPHVRGCWVVDLLLGKE
jgi:hypothetical protein